MGAALLGSSSDPDNDVLHIENLELGEGASGTLTLNDADKVQLRVLGRGRMRRLGTLMVLLR